MGGVNSGRRPTRHLGIVEQALALDIRALRRLGLVRSGECTIDTIFWSNGGSSALEARVRADLSDVDSATLVVTTQASCGVTEQRISVKGKPCRYGGRRFYFLCPDLGHRCEVLYLVAGRFASRKAHGLSYTVQSMDELGRARRRRRKLQDRLAGTGHLPRPRGMNRLVLAGRLRSALREEQALYAKRLRISLDIER